MEFQAYRGREMRLGQLGVLRALPVKGRRLIGPWCFLDRFGPLTFDAGTPMAVAAHPHIGLQTVTWLLDGEVVHDDSLGNESLLRPGGVNVMTAGHAIAHAENTPRENSGRLNGVQLWTALPDSRRKGDAAFQHVDEVPAAEYPGGIVRIFSGAMGRIVSPAEHFSEIVGADLRVHVRQTLNVPLRLGHEHAVLLLSGDAALEGQDLESGTLYYLGPGRADMSVTSAGGCRLLLVGGQPFGETVLMWWNFVARTPEEIREAREDWQARRRFGDVRGYADTRIPAPDVLRLAAPNPVS